jgi:hypothetical protein
MLSRTIPSVVRLKVLDHFLTTRTELAERLTFPRVATVIPRIGFKNRKLGPAAGRSPVKERETPHHVVQGGPVVVDGVTHDPEPLRGNLGYPLARDPSKLGSRIRVEIGVSRYRVAVRDSSAQLLGMFLGATELDGEVL